MCVGGGGGGGGRGGGNKFDRTELPPLTVDPCLLNHVHRWLIKRTRVCGLLFFFSFFLQYEKNPDASHKLDFRPCAYSNSPDKPAYLNSLIRDFA